MDKDEVKSFLRFLETASWSELLDRQAKLRTILAVVANDNVKADANFCLRPVDEEIAVRVQTDSLLLENRP